MQMQFVLSDAVAVVPNAAAADHCSCRAKNSFKLLARGFRTFVAFHRDGEPSAMSCSVAFSLLPKVASGGQNTTRFGYCAALLASSYAASQRNFRLLRTTLIGVLRKTSLEPSTKARNETKPSCA